MTYVVTAGYVTAETNIGPGRARVDIPRGATLPADVSREDVDRLLRGGSIKPVDDKPASPDEDQADEVPTGTIAEILAWVDGNPGRAALALEAEQAKGDKARSTLVADLTAIVDDTNE